MTGEQKSDPTEWKRMWFKTNKVWVATDASGEPVVKDGKVLIKYQLKQDYKYWVKPQNIQPLDSGPPQGQRKTKKKSRPKKSGARGEERPDSAAESALCEDKICIYTDGASSGNPGPAGIGVLLRYGQSEKEISESIGIATNNVAELKAIEAGLGALKSTAIPVRIFTDSSYAYGVLMRDWKARKNQQLINNIKKAMARFKDLQLIKVKGHSGHRDNERVDFLARAAIKKARRNNGPG